jgi:MoxR-like ATPase
MAKKAKQPKDIAPASVSGHVRALVQWMASGVYEKDHIIAMALLCAVAGENIFLLGPPGTAKSMVAGRLKLVFKDAKSFDYLMSRFSTPDEIFGPVSISRLKNDDRYERITDGYLPDADVVFLDEIWKAGPSIQNTLLTIINEHVFYNGGKAVRTPMKVLIAASNELPVPDEGLEALWDRFLVRMVSNCIVSDSAFFKMLRGESDNPQPLSEQLYISDKLYGEWQSGASAVTMPESVVKAVKALRKKLALLEKNDENKLRFYISDRRWRKAFRLLQTSAFLNGRSEINLSDFLLLVHSFWSDVESIPALLEAVTSSIVANTEAQLDKIDKAIKQIVVPSRAVSALQTAVSNMPGSEFAEFDYFYYRVENYPDGETYFAKMDYLSLSSEPREGIRFYDTKRRKILIHILEPGRQFQPTATSSNLKRIVVERMAGGAVIDGVPYYFTRKFPARQTVNPAPAEAEKQEPVYQRIQNLVAAFASCRDEWNTYMADNWTDTPNIFLSEADNLLIERKNKSVTDRIEATQVKLNNIVMLVK